MPAHKPNPTKGVLLVMGAVFIFALSDTVTKHLATIYPVSIVLLMRYLVNVVLLLAILFPSQGAAFWRTKRTALVTVRALTLCVASMTMAMALRVMPVAEAVSIVYLAPFAVMLLAMPLLGERVNWVGWLGAGLGFTGVFLIARPGGNLAPLGVALCMINAVCGTAYNLLTKVLSRSETTNALLFNTAFVGALVFALLSIGQWHGPMPGLIDFGLMLLLGLLMTSGHFLFTAAYREAPASTVAPIGYMQLFWSGGLGWLVFGHVPDAISLIGMGLVVVAGVSIALRSHFDGRKAQALAAR
jgi:drug/metabolite transporter (DMT)-like permease